MTHWITLFPFGASQPNVSTFNFTTNQTIANGFVVALSADGRFNIYSHAATGLIVDVSGYFSSESSDANGQGLLFTPLSAPVRLLDTRAGFAACDAPQAPLGTDATLALTAVRACSGAPGTARAVVGNATAVNAPTISSGAHWITLFPFGVSQLNISTLNFTDNQIIANGVVVGLSADGRLNIYSHAGTHFILDVSGYFAP